MSYKRKPKSKLAPFIPVIRTTWQSPAWKQLSYGARCLYIELRSYLRPDNLNNGKRLFRDYRGAADALGTKSLRSIQRWFRELEHYGFIVQMSGACLGPNGKGISAHWRITECPTFDDKGNHTAATRDFDQWDGVLFDDPEKTESRIPKGNKLLPKGIHTGTPKRSQKRPKRIPKGNIETTPGMLPKGIRNYLPPPVETSVGDSAIGVASAVDARADARVVRTGHQRMLRAIDSAGPDYLAAFGITPEGWASWRRGGSGTPSTGKRPWASPMLVEVDPTAIYDTPPRDGDNEPAWVQ